MGMKESANESGEAYLKGRKAGIDGTYGQNRKGLAEKTAIGGGDQSDGGTLDPALRGAAKSMYGKAVHNKGDAIGDRALFDR